MSYSSLPLTSKLFQLTTLSFALALAGCGGGGDGGTDILPPKPDLDGPGSGNSGGNNNGGDNGGEQTPAEDFSLQKLYTTPTNIKLTDEPVTFTVTVKAVAKLGGAAVNKSVSLSVDDSANTGVTIQGVSTQRTDDKGEATYELKLNPLVLNDKQKAALLANGFGLKATAKPIANKPEIQQVTNVRVSKEGSGGGVQTEVSALNIENSLQTTSVSNNNLNPYGDNAQFSIVLKNTDGARAANVEVGMGIADIKGVAIVGGSSKTTDNNGIATFNIEIAENLSKVERDALLNGVGYAINITEKNGATKKTTGTLPVALPVSDYKIAISGNADTINAYGDSQTLTVNANAVNNKVPTTISGAKASIKLNNAIKGISLNTETLTFNANGQAIVDIIVAPTLSESDRNKLAKEGISYTVTLSEPNRSTTVTTAKSSAYVPTAQYQVKAGVASKSRISSFGSSVVISFRVSDKAGGAIVGQKVTASLPTALIQKGLLSLDNAATQNTDTKGEVSYTVSIPKGLSESDRALLEQAGGFVLNAKATETSGASSEISSERVQVTAESETILSANSIPSAVNVLKDTFNIQVLAKRPDGSAASDKSVKLTIVKVAGVSIQGSQQTTNAAGVATFKVNIKALSDKERDALVKSGIPYTVNLTDDDGVVTETYKAPVIMPVAEYQLNASTVSKNKLLSTGGDTVVSFRVNDKKGGIIKGQSVTASLPSNLTENGLVTLKSAANQVTDEQGMVRYTVSIPEGLSATQRKQLQDVGGFVLNAQLTESSGISINKDSQRVSVSADPSRSATLVTSKSVPSVINVLKDQFTIQVAAKRPNGSAAADKPVELIIDSIKGISIAGNKKTTNSSGNATFVVNIDSSLSLNERKALATSGIVYKVVLNDDDGIAVENYRAAAEIPAAQYKISFNKFSNSQLSNAGGTTTVSFRVNDQNGGVIANQKVTASLPQLLVNAGVLTLNGSAEQFTDNEGMVSFDVRVPTGLSTEQKSLLINNSGFVVSVKALESSGASSGTSVAINITDKVQQSKTILKSQSTPKVVNILKDSFTIQVTGTRNDSSTAANKVVKLSLHNVVGLSVEENNRVTDNAGNATFTVNIDPNLNLDQRKKIAQEGINYTAILTDDDGIVEQNFKASVTVPAAQYKISFGQLSSTQLSSAGGTTTVSFRVNDKNGGVVTDQEVAVMLPSVLTEAGLLTLDGSSIQTTNSSGIVSFDMRVPTGLSADKKAVLEKATGFVLNARITEASGASTTTQSAPITITSKAQVSKTKLRTQSNPKIINILKDSFTIQVSGTRPNGSSAANKVVKLTIDNAAGISVQDSEQSTDNAGNTTFTVNIDPELSQAQRDALVASGLDYTVSLTDDDGVATSKSNVSVMIPAAQYQINFGTLSNAQLSSSGGSTVVSFRVNDKNGGTVVNQKVTAELPKSLVGLLILDGQASQTTDSKGIVNFTVRIPAGLSAEQKATLEKQSSFVLSAKAIEASGASSSIESRDISISNKVAVSTTRVSSNTVPSVVNVLKDQFKIQVFGKRANGSAAADKAVKLIIKDVAGISIQGSEQTTNASGNAVFTVNIDPSLDIEARKKLARDGIKYTAILTDSDGIAEKDFTVAASVPDSQYNINFSPSNSSQLPSSGGSIVVSFRVTDKSGGAIANQNVNASLPKALADAGLLAFNGSASQTTNAQGVVNYTVSVPNNLNAQQKKQLEEATGFTINAVLIENSGARSQVASQAIAINASSKTTLISSSTPNVVNVLKDQFTIQVSGKRPNGSAAAGKVVKLALDDIAGITIQNSEQTTNASGIATFTANIDPSLDLDARKKLAQQVIAYTATLIDEDGIKEQRFTTTAEVPAAQYKINFGAISNDQLASSGGTTVISFRVNDKNGGIIVGQRVTAVLTKELVDAGLLTLDSAATQVTNSQGMVSYTVRVPTELSQAQKDRLESLGGFNLTAAIIEESGAASTVSSGKVKVAKEAGPSKTTINSATTPEVVNVLKDQFTIQVSGKLPNGNAANDKIVKLTLKTTGLSVKADEQRTNANGTATFTVNIDPALTQEQRKALAASGIAYTAILTDDDGIAKQDFTAQATVPTAKYIINFGTSSKDQLSSSGGSATITFRVNDKNGGVIAGQVVTAKLPEKLVGLLTLDGNASQTTNNRGEVSYTVRVPAGLSPTQKANLERAVSFKLSATAVEASGASSQIDSGEIAISKQLQKSDSSVSAQTTPVVVNVLKDQFTIQVVGKKPNGSTVTDKVVKLMLKTTGLSVKADEQRTSANGTATFTVTIDSSLTQAQRKAIAASGIAYTAILTDDDGIAEQDFTAQAEVPAAQYQINFGAVSKAQLSSSGGSAVISFRVNDKKGGVIADQEVIATLPKKLVDAGLLTLDSAATQTTNANGIVNYTVRVPAGLNAAQKTILESEGKFILSATAIEASGASSSVTSQGIAISDEVKVSESVVTSTTTPNVINVLKDQFTIQVLGKRRDGSAAAGKVVKLVIDKTTGLSIAGSEQTTNAAGTATFTVNIDPSLTRAQREALVASGIAYTAILTDDDGIAEQDFSAQAVAPEAQYQINFGTSSNTQLSSSGGSTVISFRVNDDNGGVVVNNEVTATLPKDLVDAGLLTLDSIATQVTNSEGMVSYSVRVPKGLNEAQKSRLEQVGTFILTATTTDELGQRTQATSNNLLITDKNVISNILLTSNSSPNSISVYDDMLTIVITGKYPDSSAAFGRKVKLSIEDAPGVVIEDSEQTTNKAGQVSFTVRINQSLTEVQKNALINNGINYVATITDEDNLQKSISDTIEVKEPETSLNFASIITPTISEFGGEGVIRLQLLNNQTSTAAQNKEVSILLGKKAQDYGVTVNKNSNNTDFKGETTFIVTIPEGLTSKQREELKAVGINYQLSYIEKGEKYTPDDIQQVVITTPAVDLTVLNNPNLINNRPFYTLNGEGDTVVVSAGLSTQKTSFGINGQPIELTFEDKTLAALLNVNGKLGSAINTVITNVDGTANFTVIVPNNLTPAQKASLKNQKLKATLTETLTGKTQEIQFNVQSTKAAIDLIAITAEPLNLNGGQTQVEVIAKDSKDNVIAGQKVFLALPASVAAQGVKLVSTKDQITDNSGRVSYTLAVPAGLSQAQKDAIGSSFVVAFSAADANGNIATKTSTVTTKTPAANGTQENLTIGANKVVNTKGDTFKVFVRLNDNDGSIDGREVRLNVDEPIKTGVTVTNGTATTNSDGVATFDLTLESGANVNQALLEQGIRLTATTTTAENTELEQNYVVAVDTSTIDNYQILISSDKSTLTTGGDQTNTIFRVTDSNGGILVGVPVQLSIANLSASGAALTTPSMVTTDGNGQINVGVLLAANSVNARLNHTIDIEAKIVTPTYDVDGNISLEVREQKTLSLSAVGTNVDIEASNTKLKDSEEITITTTLIDGAGQKIANAGMELVDASGDLIMPTASAITNTDGKAVFEIAEDQLTFDSNGNLQVYARAVGENKVNTQRSINSVNLVKISQAGISFVDIVDVYDVNVPQDINIQIRTDLPAQAQALIGKSLEVQTTIGTFANNDVIVTKPIDAANINGNIITIPVTLTSSLAGITVLQATVLGENLQNGQPRYQTTVDTRFRATTPAKMLFQAVKSVITPGSSTEIVATVKDKNDVPVEGQTVVFSRASDSSAGRLSAATAVTNSRGEARVVYQANASSPIGGVIINARLLQDNGNIGSKTTNITVSKEAVYTTLAFSNKLSSDDIYYTVRGSISVMDGSGRAVANQEVSIKSYATEYAQGVYCLLDSTTTYQAADIDELDEFGNVIKTTTPEPKVFSEKTPVPLKSDWYPTEDANYNYTLDQDSDPILNEDKNSSGKLEAINPVTILGNKVSEDGYSFITDDEGRADFEIRYPLRYSNWVKVRFDASTFVNGSENTQSINYQLPTSVDDLIINDTTLITPWIGNASPFGTGGATCTNSLSVTINENTPRTRVTLSPYSPNYNVTIDGQGTSNAPSAGFNTYIIDFNKAYELGSTVTVNNNGFGFSKVIRVE